VLGRRKADPQPDFVAQPAPGGGQQVLGRCRAALTAPRAAHQSTRIDPQRGRRWVTVHTGIKADKASSNHLAGDDH